MGTAVVALAPGSTVGWGATYCVQWEWLPISPGSVRYAVPGDSALGSMHNAPVFKMMSEGTGANRPVVSVTSVMQDPTAL